MSRESSSCGCDNESCAPAEPIACTLAGHAQQMKRAAEFQQAFGHLQRTESFENGFRWYFHADSALEAVLRDLARREHECCRFFEFQIARVGGELVWETRAPAAATAVLEEFKRLPATLAKPSTLDAMRRALSDVGLSFPSDAPERDPRS